MARERYEKNIAKSTLQEQEVMKKAQVEKTQAEQRGREEVSKEVRARAEEDSKGVKAKSEKGNKEPDALGSQDSVEAKEQAKKIQTAQRDKKLLSVPYDLIL